MPEGPSIIILKEILDELELKGQHVKGVSGNTKIDSQRMLNQQVLDIKSWGKQFFICFNGFSLRVHFLLFGTYRINERKDSMPRLRLNFDQDEINLYGCSIQYLEGDINMHYDWSVDVMSPSWNAAGALQKLNAKPKLMVCDALLDQDIFAGVGNIIKNEVLFRIKVHPASLIGALSQNKIISMIEEARTYSFEFLEWKKEYTLKAHWLAHTKKTCPRCHIPFHKEYLGKTNRRSYFCTNCQELYLI